MKRTIFETEHDLFRASVQQFLEVEILPFHEEWAAAGKVDKEMFRKAGSVGLLGMSIPEEFGGGGVDDFRYNAVIDEVFTGSTAGSSGMCITLHNDICVPYFLTYCTPEQKQRWVPGLASGDLMTAIAMTEPGTGSDLTGIATSAHLEGDHYVVNGSKTFITNGINADLVIVVVRTGDDPHGGLTLLVIEDAMDGFERGRNLDKMGLHAQDTAELFFNDVEVPVINRLGDEGMGFFQLMANLPQERLSIAIGAVAGAEAALEMTIEYAKERKAFGRPIGRFQHNRFVLAEAKTEVDIARVFVDRLLEAHVAGELTIEQAAEAKWWTTEMLRRVVDMGVQMHGGYGYMMEYPIAQAYLDARVSTIYGGTTEIMKEIIGRAMGV
ncbi:Acyl-CoA dehydrogenase [hydrothermal vent metagenome]|uniref:Acyl-CoA dehydrogenase n=1 Tax=hydrothermal vent metagenome TaxID=652676 RepID=A0A3B0REW4_9ZZZZ